MTYTQPQLADITEYAGLFFGAKEIGLILDLPLVEFQRDVANPETDAHRAYLRGKLLAQASVRKTVKNLATSGSSPAIVLLNKMIDEQSHAEAVMKQLYGEAD
jgi:hypothetical protein